MMYRFVLHFVLWAFLVLPLQAQVHDTAVFERLLQYAEQGDNSIIHTARFFLDTPYVGGTLEGDSVEQLRVNLRELDCITFVENVVAMQLMSQSSNHTFGNFCNILQRIRYRNGIIDSYLSRLHYTSEWLDDNRRKGIIDLQRPATCRDYASNVSFMSTHCDAYPALKTHPDWCREMQTIENRIKTLRFCYIPKENVKTAEPVIQDGDIIAITTHIKGLDIAHVGFALVQHGRIYLLHASSEAKKVVISDEPLHDYLARRKNHSGIIVARLKEHVLTNPDNHD